MKMGKKKKEVQDLAGEKRIYRYETMHYYYCLPMHLHGSEYWYQTVVLAMGK